MPSRVDDAIKIVLDAVCEDKTLDSDREYQAVVVVLDTLRKMVSLAKS